MEHDKAIIRIGYAYKMKLSREDAVKLFVRSITADPECAKLKKNVQRAIFYKKKGDSSFADSAYKDALKHYTKSLKLIPDNTDKEGIIYMSRSVTLKKLQAYKEAIMDGQRALKCPISEDLKTKLYTRINKLQSRLIKESKMGKSTEKFREDCPTVAYGDNSQIPGASSAVALSEDSQNIRRLHTVRPVKTGDVLLVLKPHIAIVNELEEDSIFTCHHCLKHYLAPIPCTSCARAIYCSAKCRTESRNSHKYECEVSACETTEFIAALKMLLFVANQGRDADGGLIANCHRVIDSLVPFLTDKEEVENDHPQNYLASFMAVFLKTRTDFSDENYDACDLAHVILRLGQIIQTKGVGIKCSSKNNISGIAVYPVFSLLQCHKWNTISYTYGTTVKVLRASRDIAQGEQIFENQYEAVTMKTVFQIEGIELVNELHVLCFHNKDPDDDDYRPFSIEKMKLPLHLIRRLRKSPNDVRCMWEVMDFMNKSAKKPCCALNYMKMMLEDAYMGCENEWLREFYAHIGVW